MRRAIDETDRRRTKQMAHNEAHNIAFSVKREALTFLKERKRKEYAEGSLKNGRLEQCRIGLDDLEKQILMESKCSCAKVLKKRHNCVTG